MNEAKNLAQALRRPSMVGLTEQAQRALAQIRGRCDVVGDCWLWRQSVNSSGYPQMKMDGVLKMVRQHVLCDVMEVELPAGWWASTTCRQKRCCSPICLAGMPRGAVMERSYAAGARPSLGGCVDRLSQLVLAGVARGKGPAAGGRRGQGMHPGASVFAMAALV